MIASSRPVVSALTARPSLLCLVLCGLLLSCATYRDDLDRAMAHYNQDNQYDKALALLEVLEPDIDSFSPAERAQYAYYRGMAHFRLGHRRHARHWLGVAAALEKKNEGALAVAEQKRVSDTLDELNKDVWGKKESGPLSGDSCKADAECGQGRFCDAGTCKDSPKPDPNVGQACAGDTDCGGGLTCTAGTCAPAPADPSLGPPPAAPPGTAPPAAPPAAPPGTAPPAAPPVTPASP